MKKNKSGTISVLLLLLITFLPAKNIANDYALFGANQKDSEQNVQSGTKKSSKIALIDTLKVTSKTRIIGTCYDHSNKYDFFCFILKDSTSIVQFAKSLKGGKLMPNVINGDEFNIDIIDNYRMINHLAINPMLNTLRINGKTYDFDFVPLKKLYKKHSLNCEEEKVEFNNKNEADNYVAEIKKDTNLLYYHAPEFRYEGSFTMTVKKNTMFSSPKAVMNYLTPEIEKIVHHGEYMMLFSVNMANIESQIQSDSYTITITGSKKLFDNLNIDQIQKDNWHYSGKQPGFFYFKR